MGDSREVAPGDLHAFAAAVAHEIRTPLSAVAGEIDLALRRDRSAAEYRDALRRIAAGISELVEISGDLTLLSEPDQPSTGTLPAARLDSILLQLEERYRARDNVTVVVDHEARVCVAGIEERLARAITLVVEHAIRHRRNQAPVSLHCAGTSSGRVRLVVDAQPPGFWPHAWSALTENDDPACGPLRLRTARRILERSGGALRVASDSGTAAVHIELQPCV